MSITFVWKLPGQPGVAWTRGEVSPAALRDAGGRLLVGNGLAAIYHRQSPPIDRYHWLVEYRGAVGTTHPAEAWFEHEMFTTFRDALNAAIRLDRSLAVGGRARANTAPRRREGR